MRKVKFGKEEIKKAKRVKSIPFVVTLHSQLKNLGRIINQNIYLLNMNEETKKVFSPRFYFHHLGVLVKQVVIW